MGIRRNKRDATGESEDVQLISTPQKSQKSEEKKQITDMSHQPLDLQ